MDDAVWRNKLASKIVRVAFRKYFRARMRAFGASGAFAWCVAAPRWQRNFLDISSTTKHEERKRVQRDQFSSPFLAWFSITEFSFSLSFALSLVFMPFSIVTHTLAFLTQYRSCTLSRKSKASGVDLPTSSARRRKSTWGKEPGNSPRLNSNR